ncbi:MAG: L-threonylcarbamoyladenylate synthase, partial [Chloroflexota bacterium]|nr:L-threonylcarbamoyladenylate synthase [Chloroflexota bacterium]
MEEQLRHAVAILMEGGVIAYPTDTVYGLGADAFNEEAVGRIYRIKQRLLSQPLSLLLAERSDLSTAADTISGTAELLAQHFWPGGLTLIVHKSSKIPLWITAGGDTVAVRVPNHPVALELIRQLGKPLIGTSANLSGSPNLTTAREVGEQLGDTIDFVLDGGVCPGGT